MRAAKHLHLTAWSFFVDPPRAAARAAAHLARDSGATLSFDPASFQMIEEMGVDQFLACTQDLGIDVFLPNYQEGEVLTGLDEPEAIAAALAKLYPQALIMLKLDADGALVYENGVATPVPPATNNLVDATGAGDSFAGAFLARYLGGATALDAAHFATKISAWVIEQLGARPKPDARLRHHPASSEFGQRCGHRGWQSVAMTTATDRFRALHSDGIFVMPNPYDLGSARLLAALGFSALASTSAGFAATLGRLDMMVTRDELLAHVGPVGRGHRSAVERRLRALLRR